MAKIQAIDDALRRWAAWADGDGSGVGYPAMSVLHPDWSPPSPGQTPTMRTAPHGSDVHATNQALRALSIRSQATVELHYRRRDNRRLTLSEQGLLLGCQPDTVTKRVEAIHRALAPFLLAEG